MHTRSLVSLLIAASLMAASASCGGPTAPADGGAIDAGPDGGRVEPCTRDLECGDQDLFCSDWRCRPGEPGTDARGCIDLGSSCPPGASCDEEMRSCGDLPAWCTEGRAGCMEPGNCDGDGEPSRECGGQDCDDDDGRRYPGGTEVCDPDGVDEDCMSSTFGELDADGDGFTSAECCNGDVCADDCDDSRRDVHPGAAEACNAIDDDCNGFVDDPGAFCPVGTCVDRRCRALSWEWTYGGLGREAVFGLATDGDGNIYLLLFAGANFDIDADGREESIGTYLVSLYPDGRHRWAVPVGDGFTYSGVGMALTPDGAQVVTGVGGQLQWIDTSDGSIGRRVDLVPPTGWDEVAIVSLAFSAEHLFVGSTLLRSSGGAGVLLTKLDMAGAELDERILETGGSRSPSPLSAISSSSSGDVAILAQSMMPLELGTGTPITGEFVARLRPDLTTDWAHELPILNDLELSPDVAISETGDVAVVGSYSGSTSAFGETWPDLCGGTSSCRALSIVSLAPDGAHRWSRQLQGILPSIGSTRPSLAFDERGGIAVAGTFAGTLDVRPYGSWTAGAPEGGCDAFLAVFDATDESVLQARRITGPACSENVSATVVDPFGATLIAGTFRVSVTLLRGTYPSEGEVDAFLLRVSD